MTSYKQDTDFLKYVISGCLLEDAVDWISSNLEPEEVFANYKLVEWAIEAGFVKGEE